MDNKHISKTTKASSEGILNNFTEPNLPQESVDECHTNVFDTILLNIKEEKCSHLHVEPTDLKSFTSIADKSIDNKNKKQLQDKMCELASIYYEKDVNDFESNSRELTDTKSVDGKVVCKYTNSPSTTLPIMKMLSSKSRPHTCVECCFMCNNSFRLLDSPLHICQIQSTDKQNEFLKIEPSLCIDSCLCEFCWKYLVNTYKSNKPKNKKKESYSEKKFRLLERYVKKKVSKKQNQTRRCSIHLCSQPYCHKMSVNECENIKKLFLTFESCHLVFIQSTKQTTDFLKFPFCLCEIHYGMILVMSTCQICGDKLNAPFNTDDWSMYEIWNFVLMENYLPLILKPGMFICVTCKGHISKKNPGFPSIDLPRLLEHILTSEATRLQLYGDSLYNLFNIRQESTYVGSPIVVPQIKDEKESVRSIKVKFADPLITTNYNFEISHCENDTESITSTAQQNNQSKLNYHDLYSVSQDGSSMDLKEAVKPLNAIVNSVSIKRKQCNDIYDTIFDEDLKKQILNEKYSFYKYNSIDDNTAKSYRNQNIAYPNLSVDVDKDIKLHTNMPSNHIKKAYSLDPNSVYNSKNLLRYLMENLRMLPNLELAVSDEFYREYLKEHKTTLYNCFGNPMNSVISKSFIHLSSHLHQYSKRLSSDDELLVIKDITTTTSSSTQSNSIASKKKYTAPNNGVGRILLPLCNLVSKSRNNIISTNSVSKVPDHLSTYTKLLLTSDIPYLLDDYQTFTDLTLQNPTNDTISYPNNIIQFPVAIKKKKS